MPLHNLAEDRLAKLSEIPTTTTTIEMTRLEVCNRVVMDMECNEVQLRVMSVRDSVQGEKNKKDCESSVDEMQPRTKHRLSLQLSVPPVHRTISTDMNNTSLRDNTYENEPSALETQ